MTDIDPTAAAAAAPDQAQETTWAIVELMGHQRIAGRISQQAFGGANLIRIDVPEVVLMEQHYTTGERQEVQVTIPAHTRSLGAASIYGINWCDEAAATIAAHSIKHQPIVPYGLKQVLNHMPAEQRAKVVGLLAPDSPLFAIANTTAGDDDVHF